VDALNELDAVSGAFIGKDQMGGPSGRIFWDIVSSAAGAVFGLAATGHPAGAVVGAAAVPLLVEGGKRLAGPILSHGSIDLGRRLGREFLKVSTSSMDDLARLLAASERKKLNL